jgi:hypothetical protein
VVIRPARKNASTEPPTRRVILLGASNLVRSMPTVLETALLCRGGALEAFLACGHGRSYGITTRVMGRTLPGIVECGVWEALAARPPLETTALVTDIGNDLLYGVSVPQIAAWVEQCLDRLLQHGARPVITALPLTNLAGLPAARFKLLRSLLYPRCRLSLEEVRDAALRLDERVRELAASRGATLAEHRSDWYGLDPIHIRYRHAPAAWREVLAAWSEPTVGQAAPMSWWTWAWMHRLRPAQRWVMGIEQRAAQPVLRCADGTTVWLY